LAIRAYCPYHGVDWENRWCENNVSEISQQFKTIVKALEAAVPTVVTLREEARKKAEAERERWEAQWREHEKIPAMLFMPLLSEVEVIRRLLIEKGVFTSDELNQTFKRLEAEQPRCGGVE
jgi:hypothetical protein